MAPSWYEEVALPLAAILGLDLKSLELPILASIFATAVAVAAFVADEKRCVTAGRAGEFFNGLRKKSTLSRMALVAGHRHSVMWRNAATLVASTSACGIDSHTG